MTHVDVDAFALLDNVWRRLQVGTGGEQADAGAKGYLLALHEIGAISEVEADGWAARFTRCPDGGEAECHGSLKWCNYCGDVSGCPNGSDCCDESEGGA